MPWLSSATVSQRSNQPMYLTRGTGVGPTGRHGEHDEAFQRRMHDGHGREPRIHDAGDGHDRVATARCHRLALQLHRVRLGHDVQSQTVVVRQAIKTGA